jgi:mRNA interferase RelE/StbE
VTGRPPADPYEVRWSAAAKRAITERIPENVAAAVVELVLNALRHEPRRVGKPLREPFAGRWSARRGTYRVIYSIDEDKHLIVIEVIRHRDTAYRPR